MRSWLLALVMSGPAAMAVDGRSVHAEPAKTRAAASSSGRATSSATPLPSSAKRVAKSPSAPKMSHEEAAAMLKVSIMQVEAANRELDSLHEESKRLTAQLHAANLQIQRGRQRLLAGQRTQKAGREMRRKGALEAGEARIAAGQKEVDAGAREMEQGVAIVRTTQAELNALSVRVARVREQADEGRRKVKIAEASM